MCFGISFFQRMCKEVELVSPKLAFFCEPYIYCKFLTCGSMAHQSKSPCKATVLQLAGLKLMTYRSQPDALTNHDKLLSNKWLKCKKYKVVYFQSREREYVTKWRGPISPSKETCGKVYFHNANLWPVIASGITKHVPLGVKTAGRQGLVKSLWGLQFGSSIFVPETELAVWTHGGQSTMNRMECNIIYLQVIQNTCSVMQHITIA